MRQKQQLSLKSKVILALGWVSLAIYLVTFPAGLWLPMLTSSKFVFSKHTFSLLTGIIDLYKGNEYALALLIGLFCVVTPTIKLLLLLKFWIQGNNDHRPKSIEWISRIGKWSMIDVFMCAVLFVTLKLGYTVSIQIHSGLYFFITAVISSMIATECALEWTKTNANTQ